MNSLLKRQIRKYLPKELHSDEKLEKFLDAIDRSYTTSDDQFAMLQRATTISSEELFKANEQLKEESNSQKKVITKLENVIDNLQVYDLDNNRPKEGMDSLTLVDFIDNQTKEIIKINQQKDKLLKNLERQNQELNDYTHLVSHDLKSPLQSIDAIVSWIKEDYSEVLNEDCNYKMNLIQDNVKKMDSLVKGILLYATVGKVEDDFYTVNLNDIVKKITKNINTSKNIEFIIAKNLPNVKGDVFRLELLFSSIIDNAIKFNDKENPKIEIGYKEEENYWNFFVKDNGKGIEEKYFEKIFIAFQKLEDDYKSTGIGLSIAKKIIELYNGKIWLESNLNKGSIFYFSIKKQLWNNLI